MKYNIGDKCKIVNSYMNHLIGKTVTIKNLKYYNPPFYDCTIDDMNNLDIVCSESSIEKIEED